MGDEERGADRACTAVAAAEAIAEDGEGRLFCLAMQRRESLAGGKEPALSRCRPGGLRSDRPSRKAAGATLPSQGAQHRHGITRRSARGSFPAGPHEKPADVLGGELHTDRGCERVTPEVAEIVVEVAEDRAQRQRLDAGLLSSCG